MRAMKFVFAGACLLGAAQDSVIKDGLWSIHTVGETTRNGVSDSMEGTAQKCQKRGAMDQILNPPAVKDCKLLKTQTSGNTTVSEMECTVNGSDITVKETIVKKSEDEVRTITDSTMNPPMGGISAMKLTADMKFIGACPSDMQPGDIRLPDGKVMHGFGR